MTNPKTKNSRPRINKSSYITYVASKLAEVKGISIEEVAEITAQNAVEVFRL
ncbi:MAG: TatD family hydrolase [Crocinitomicaceae bacterium]